MTFFMILPSGIRGSSRERSVKIMWRDYSIGFIKRNRASSLSVIVAAFISALFLSWLCGLFYNFWNYEIERIVSEEGDWQGRICGTFDERVVSDIKNFANVDAVTINPKLSDENNLVVDIRFQNMRTVYRDMPLIAEQLGVSDRDLSYHELLLSRYFVHDPQDTAPPLLPAFCAAVLVMVCVSLILIIHNSFSVSMDARVHQFGIFSSIGATPGQIRACLLQEAAILCIPPILLGTGIGAALCFGTIQLVNQLAKEIVGRHEAVFTYHPLVLGITILAAVLTVFISAWLPARKLSKLTPIEAIRNSGELHLKKKKNVRFLSLVFGAEGELAGSALKAQKKALRTSAISLTLSFMGFTLMLCFFTLSEISTNHTYFERYQNAWDVMATIEDTDLEDFTKTDDVQSIGKADSVIYQKAEALCPVLETNFSDRLNELGGVEAVAGDSVRIVDGSYLVDAPIIIMDDKSFEAYCRRIGVNSKSTGSIVLNRIWDSVNSNFRYKKYVSFLSEEQDSIVLQNTEQTEETVELPILAYTQEPPVLREEYDNYTLVQFLSLSTWKQIENTIGHTEADTYIRVLAEGDRELSALKAIETEISDMIGDNFTFEMENRVQERRDNEEMVNGYKIVIGALCVLLAVIGIANVFSNTLGFIRQRNREFARYMSIGLTPKGVRKMFFIEALVIAGRPLLITLPLTVLSVGFMITASCLNPMEFLTKAPILPAAVFILGIFVFVALAYCMGGRKIMKCNLAEALRMDDIV
ncbi:putative uncharacterized protein [Blautia hydrogenotrophica CAG:147]|nr:putative uncharacterized protein [Blautia hydrogenotrophica CAG:147]